MNINSCIHYRLLHSVSSILLILFMRNRVYIWKWMYGIFVHTFFFSFHSLWHVHCQRFDSYSICLLTSASLLLAKQHLQNIIHKWSSLLYKYHILGPHSIELFYCEQSSYSNLQREIDAVYFRILSLNFFSLNPKDTKNCLIERLDFAMQDNTRIKDSYHLRILVWDILCEARS